jgi:hypothetical protein
VGSERPAPLDLSRPRTLGELLNATLEVFGRHADVLLTLALILVAPATILVDGVWGGGLADGPDAKPSVAAQGVRAALSVFVIVPLATASVALVVRGLGDGAAPRDVRDALRAGAQAFPRVLGAVVLYGIAVLAGLVLVVVPGIWVMVSGYFAAQAAALDGLGPAAALRSSLDAVRGVWLRTLGCLLAPLFLFGLVGTVAIGIFGTTGSGAVYVAGATIVESVVIALSAIFATLLFYDLRARRARPADEGFEKMVP